MFVHPIKKVNKQRNQRLGVLQIDLIRVVFCMHTEGEDGCFTEHCFKLSQEWDSAPVAYSPETLPKACK